MRIAAIPALVAAFTAALLAAAPTVSAGSADVVRVEVRRQVKSDDTGWSHYADAFEVLAPDGTVLGRRVLLHPHEDEQPFTRDLYGVRIPDGVTRVTVRARHKVRGYDGAVVTVTLPR